MGVRIRLAKFGCRNRPFYRVIPANSRSPGDGKHLENLGYWLSVGEQPSDPVRSLLIRAGVLPPPAMVPTVPQGGPRDMRPVDPLTGRIIVEKAATNAAVASALEVTNANEGEGFLGMK